MVRIVNRYLPDPLVFAILLSIIVFIWGSFIYIPKVDSNSINDMIGFWGDGFWNLLAFTTQMSMIVVTGFALASSEPMSKILKRIANLAKTPL